jgi:hypothetical protein
MIILVLLIQIVSLVFYFRIIAESLDYNTGRESSLGHYPTKCVS